MVDRAVQSGTVTVLLFRAVSHAEFADVTNHGIFRAGPNSYATGKFFAEAGGDALQWGAALEGLGNFRILGVEFPKVVADQFMRFNRLDNIGPARFARFDELNQPTIRLWSGSP
jgi:hypothetical protein